MIHNSVIRVGYPESVPPNPWYSASPDQYHDMPPVQGEASPHPHPGCRGRAAYRGIGLGRCVIGVSYAGKRVPPNPWYSASPEANTITAARHRSEGVPAASRAFAPIRSSGLHHRARSQQRREPYHVRPSNPASVSASSGRRCRAAHDINAPASASIRCRPPSILFAVQKIRQAKSFRCLQGLPVLPLLAVRLLGKKAEAWGGSLCHEKFPFLRFTAHPISSMGNCPSIEQHTARCLPTAAGDCPERYRNGRRKTGRPFRRMVAPLQRSAGASAARAKGDLPSSRRGESSD